MTSLFDFLTNTGDKIKNVGSGLFERLTNTPTQLLAIQLDGNGDIDSFSTLDIAQNTSPRKLSEHLFGRNMTMDKQNYNPETNTFEAETISNFKPGFFNNLQFGIQENYDNPFTVNNLAPKGRGIGNKIGEGLGSVARGLAGWGGDAWIAGQEGLSAAIKRQNLRSADEIYRKLLSDDGIDTNNLHGLVNADTFHNYALHKYRNKNLDIKMQLGQMKDNTSRAKMIMSGLNNGTMTPEEAMQHMQDYGITFNDLQLSNKTRNTNVNEAIMPAKINALNAGANASLTNAANNTTRTNAYVEALENKPTKPENNPDYNNDLANYVTIMTDGKYASSRNEARKRFIQKYGIDPMKKAEVW